MPDRSFSVTVPQKKRASPTWMETLCIKKMQRFNTGSVSQELELLGAAVRTYLCWLSPCQLNVDLAVPFTRLHTSGSKLGCCVGQRDAQSCHQHSGGDFGKGHARSQQRPWTFLRGLCGLTGLILHFLKGIFWSINRNKSNNTLTICILKRKTVKKSLKQEPRLLYLETEQITSFPTSMEQLITPFTYHQENNLCSVSTHNL